MNQPNPTCCDDPRLTNGIVCASCGWQLGLRGRSGYIERAVAEEREKRESAEDQVARLKPIVAHVAGLVHQDESGYSMVHLALIEDARSALAEGADAA